MYKYVTAIFLYFSIFWNVFSAYAGTVTVSLQTTLIDGNIEPWNSLVPGDTVLLMPGEREQLLIRNFRGTADKPFIFINTEGIVSITTDHHYGISIQNCQYFRLSGSGYPSTFYGIQIDQVENGAGIGVGDLSSDFELDHISVKNVLTAGIYAKTNPSCSSPSTREKFTQKNTVIHDVLVENAGNEGIYAGNTAWFGQIVNCDGKDTLLLPSVLDGVRIYKNIIINSGWDGIQLSSASHDCQVYENQIYYDSQDGYLNQMSGILLGGGSKCDCYNNLIADGKGDGIENHGLGGNMIFNNIIVNAGITFYPGDYEASKMKYAIFISDISTLFDSAFFILNNTIINPKSDGIRFSSSKSKGNLIASNAIINPGNFDYYENGNTRFKGIDSYIMVPDEESDITADNNFFSREISGAGMDEDYSLLQDSPLIDGGYTGLPMISFDFLYNERPVNGIPDIGAFEYQHNTGTTTLLKDETDCKIFPNPAKNQIFLELPVNTTISRLEVRVYNLSGILVLHRKEEKLSLEKELPVSIESLKNGFYLISVRLNDQIINSCFLKID